MTGRPSRTLLAGLLAVAVTTAVRYVPSLTEAWASSVAPIWSQLATRMSESAPWPWTPLLAALVLAAGRVAARRAGSKARAAARMLGFALLIAASFEASWGLHGARPPALERLAPFASAQERPLPASLAHLLRERIVADLPVGPLDEAAATAAVSAAMAPFAGGLRLPERVKSVPGWVLGPWGVAGVIGPWTLEAHVDGAMPPWQRVAIGAHELGHLAGYEDEADAELLGLLAALRADHPHARYAGALRAWRQQPASERAAAGALPPRAQDDLDTARHVARERARPFARAFGAAYDLWLRARGQEAGLAGYAEGPRRLAWAYRVGLW